MSLKVLLPITLLATATSAFAAADGFYAGANFGWARVGYNTSNFDYMTSSSINRTGATGGLSFGYQVNPNFAAELGYLWMPRVNVNNITLGSNPTGSTTLANGNIQTSVWDFAVKGLMPLSNGFGVNVKAGIARVKADVGGGLDNSALGSDYKDHTKWTPEVGVGGSYDFSKNVSTGVNYTRIFKAGTIRPIDLVLANLSYHFG